jgi:hypothetical protein
MNLWAGIDPLAADFQSVPAGPDRSLARTASLVSRKAGTRGIDTPELSPRTFWNFAREFSSFRRQGAATGERR